MSDEAATGDTELMRLAAAGDRAAFDRIVEAHAPALLRYACALTATNATAEDAVQDALLGAWRSATAYRGEASVRRWLLVIVRNAVYRQHRHRVDETADTESLEALGSEAGWGDTTPETIALQQESRARLAAALAQLSTADREIRLRRDIEGFPGEEVASMLGVSVRAMKSRLHRARLRLAAKVRQT
ncbi:MAG TPA: RNA polymerase sigma factor [Thermoanaerobaculia bacterium]|nr:RNA polymerase sigma factor [Thermoanaerobaculia bacterium]